MWNFEGTAGGLCLYHDCISMSCISVFIYTAARWLYNSHAGFQVYTNIQIWIMIFVYYYFSTSLCQIELMIGFKFKCDWSGRNKTLYFTLSETKKLILLSFFFLTFTMNNFKLKHAHFKLKTREEHPTGDLLKSQIMCSLSLHLKVC